jgi:ATP-dependent protease HslVU (ClpYQ) peptidase subunit
MTTIAYKDGELAGDGRITEDGTVITDKQRKVHRLRDGRLVGWAGSLAGSKRFLKALRDNPDTLPELKLDVNAIVIARNGKVSLFEENTWMELKQPHYAYGSGSLIALGAMDAGASATEAVRIAARRDTGSGGRVLTERLK